jgi:hypothetical protein
VVPPWLATKSLAVTQRIETGGGGR